MKLWRLWKLSRQVNLLKFAEDVDRYINECYNSKEEQEKLADDLLEAAELLDKAVR
jgi:hypothetical protein